jgi:polysaccharide chain length determinant protein (PEP-CTERM system associated)
MTVIPGKTYTPEDILRAALRRTWLIILPPILVGSIVFAYAWRLPNLYRSETLILVVPQRVPEGYIRSTVTTPIEDRLRSMQEQIRSHSRLEQVIRDFGLYVDLREKFPMEEVVAMMQDQILVSPVRGDSFRVGFTSGDPQVAKKVTERLAAMFIDENLRDRAVQAEGTSQFLETQLETARERLLEHEKRLEAYRLQYSSELPTQLQANVQLIVGQRQQLQVITESIDRDRDRRLALEKSMNDASTGVQSSPDALGGGAAEAEGPLQRLEKARAALRGLELRLKPDHPDVIAARRQVAELDAQAATLTSGAVVPSDQVPAAADVARQLRIKQYRTEIDALDRQIRNKEAELARIRQTIDEYQRRVDAAPTRETELTELMRDYTTLQSMYTSLLGKKEESKLAANLERAQAGEQFKILDPARVPEQPFSPNRVQLNLLGLVAGLGLGIGVAAILELRDTSLRTEDEVVRLFALPVIALVPMMRTAADQRRARRKIALAVGATTVMFGAAAAAAAWKLGFLGSLG